MKALFYLTRKRLKNTVVAMFRSPGQLIFLLFMAAMLGFSLFSSSQADIDPSEFRSPDELHAILFAFYALIFGLVVSTGFKSGAAFFSLADVNIVFNLPISPRRILIYGMVRQLGTSLFAGAFIFFQYGWLHISYGVTWLSLLGILLGYGLVMFCGQQVAMLVYSATAGSEKRREAAKHVTLAACAVLIVWLALPLLSVDIAGLGLNGILDTIVASVNRPAAGWIPIIGWLSMAASGALIGDWFSILLGGGATAILSLFFIWLVGRLNADYYEDVLAAAETSHSAIAAKKEGRMVEALPQNVKVGVEGLERGWGASVFYYKHRLESRRARRFFTDIASLIFILVSLGFTVVMRHYGTVFAVAMSIYMLMFASFMGRWVRELALPYVYMMPVPPFQKLLMILGETIIKNALESLVVGIGIGVICSAGPLEIVALVVLRFAAALLFIAGTILAERLFGGLPAKWMQMTFLIITILIVSIPAIVAGVVVGLLTSLAIGYFVAALCAAGEALLILFLCRNLLSIAELNNA